MAMRDFHPFISFAAVSAAPRQRFSKMRRKHPLFHATGGMLNVGEIICVCWRGNFWSFVQQVEFHFFRSSPSSSEATIKFIYFISLLP